MLGKLKITLTFMYFHDIPLWSGYVSSLQVEYIY